MMEEKGSISRVKKTSGSYSFRIEGYSGLSARVGESTESPEFLLCDHLWQLRIFPGGSLDAHKSHVSYYLASKSNRAARASYKLILVGQLPGGQDEVFSSTGVRLFEAKGVQIDGWGRDKFILHSALTEPLNGFLVEDAIVFKVEVTVYGELMSSYPPVSYLGEQGIPPLSKSMKNLLLKAGEDNGEGNITGDMKLVCKGGSGGETLCCHRIILSARSPVFSAMLAHDMQEKRNGSIIVDEDADTMSELLTFIYTDELSDPTNLGSKCVDLLVVAIKYEVGGLRSLCEAFLCDQLTDESVITILKLADRHSATKLKEISLQYLAQHFLTVAQTKQFVEFLKFDDSDNSNISKNKKKNGNGNGICNGDELKHNEDDEEEEEEDEDENFDDEDDEEREWKNLRAEVKSVIDKAAKKSSCGRSASSASTSSDGGERRFSTCIIC